LGPPSVGADDRGQDAYRGGLPGAVGAEQPEHGGGGYLEVDAVQGRDLAEPLGQALHQDRCISHGWNRAMILGICQMSGGATFRSSQISQDSEYHGAMGTDQPRPKRALAADVWRLMAECSMAQFGRASEMLQPLGLTPGHVKRMMKPEEREGRA